MELYLKFFSYLRKYTSIYRCVLQLKAKMKYNFLFCVHTSFFILYFLFFPSISFLRLFLFSASPSLLSSSPQTLLSSSPQTHRPFFLPQRPIADLHESSRHRPVAVDPRSTTDLTHFGLYSLFSAFRFCVSGCACVSAALCFGFVYRACLCFGFVFRAGWICVSGMGFGVWFLRLGNWIWVWWVSAFGCG